MPPRNTGDTAEKRRSFDTPTTEVEQKVNTALTSPETKFQGKEGPGPEPEKKDKETHVPKARPSNVQRPATSAAVQSRTDAERRAEAEKRARAEQERQPKANVSSGMRTTQTGSKSKE